MSYEHRSNVSSRRVPNTVKIISTVVLLLFIIDFFIPRLFPTVVTFIVHPLWSVSKDVPLPTEFQNALVTQLQDENAHLQSVLSRNASSSQLFLAPIIKKPPFTAYDSYIIDIGNDSRIKIGDKVYALGNVLLGEIVEKNGSFAKVKLYSSYGEKFDVLIGQSAIQTGATGEGGGYLESVLPKGVKIQVGDIVTIPNLEVSVFGIVKDIQIDPERSFSTIRFSQPVNIYEQKWVQIRLK